MTEKPNVPFHKLIFDKLCYTLFELTGGFLNTTVSSEKRHIVKPELKNRHSFRARHARRSDGRFMCLLVSEYGFRRRDCMSLKDAKERCKREERQTAFWQDVVDKRNIESMRTENVDVLHEAAIAGIPSDLRGDVWLQATKCEVLQGEHPSGLFKDLCDAQRNRTIAIDVPRTFPKHPKFLEEQTQQALYNVLTAYAAYNPRVGYVQSLNFIAALFLFHVDEEQAFWMLASYMDYFKMESFYFEGMEALQVNAAHFASLALKNDRRLRRHFKIENVDLAIFATPWFLTHFIYDLPLELAARVWDVMLTTGMTQGEFVYRFGLSFLKYMGKELRRTPFEGLVEKLKILPLCENDVEEICRMALALDFDFDGVNGDGVVER